MPTCLKSIIEQLESNAVELNIPGIFGLLGIDVTGFQAMWTAIMHLVPPR